MVRSALLSLVPIAFLIPVSPARAQSDEGPPPPWEVSTRNEGEPVWGPLLRLRALAEDYRDTPYWGAYVQMLGTAESFLGNHRAALRAFDLPYPPRDSVGALPGETRARDAVEYLVERAADERIVMVNERHHAGSDRLLTLELLPRLRELGFTHFAAEALDPNDSLRNERAYPVEGSGYYTREAVFAEVLREAQRLGFELVAYESLGEPVGEDTLLTSQQFRDLSQARTLAAVFDRDPGARLFVHAGYSHILEEETERWSPMALYLRELTGVDALTVDQTRLSERGDAEHEHPQYRAARRGGLIVDRPVVLENPDGSLRAPVRQAVDVQVFTPRTVYRDGRPAWMAMGDRRVPVRLDIPEAANAWCHVEARLADEPAEALPLDGCEVDHVPEVVLYLPPGERVAIRIRDLEGNTLRTLELGGN